MKRITAILLIMVLVFGFCSCGKPKEEVPEYNASEKSEGVMTYAEYDSAAIGDSVCIEAFVQAHQIWHKDAVSVYAQDPDGGYFIYNMLCSKEDSERLVPGTKIKVEGKKDEWQGEIRIIDASFIIIEDGSWIAAAEDLTAVIGTEAMDSKQNILAAFTGVIVAGQPRLKYDGSGINGDDIYLDVNIGGQTYTFMVESYLCPKNSEVYKAVKAAKPGDKLDIEAFVYRYEELNPHITSCKAVVEESQGKK